MRWVILCNGDGGDEKHQVNEVVVPLGAGGFEACGEPRDGVISASCSVEDAEHDVLLWVDDAGERRATSLLGARCFVGLTNCEGWNPKSNPKWGGLCGSGGGSTEPIYFSNFSQSFSKNFSQNFF